MKNKILWFFLFFLVAVCVFPKESPWGSLKKIHFYDSVKKYDKVLENLARIKPRDIDGTQLKDVAKDLITFGDHYFSLKEYRNAEAFYLKVIDLSPDYWYLYNRLEKIDREQGSLFIGFSNAFKQLLAMLKSFSASFIIFNTFFNLLFFACLLVFFLFGLLLFIKYFKLAANDLLLSEQGVISMKKLILVILTLLWPVLMLSGWMIYPFIIIGFLWTYINENEKKTVFFMLIFVFLFTLLYSLNLTLEQGVKDKKFKTIQKLCSGHLFAGDVYEKFDNRLKVLQAYNYYENKQYDTALEILISTGETYEDRLKFDLMGNIYFKSDDYVESTKYYNESLRIDEHRDVTLNNFTLS
ncbi:MAG: hypothetical protein GY765_38235, partial [bacterium]|nr:hypothetical protein [bacterium]